MASIDAVSLLTITSFGDMSDMSRKHFIRTSSFAKISRNLLKVSTMNSELRFRVGFHIPTHGVTMDSRSSPVLNHTIMANLDAT